MKTNTAYIGLGSNLAQPHVQIKMAMSALNHLVTTKVITDSGYFASRPMGPEDQPDYINAVVEIKTMLSAAKLLTCCQKIEQQQGRLKTRHWGERSIDLDILLYAELQIKTEKLTVPHPGVCLRDFVYMPLLKINPDIIVPGIGQLSEMVKLSNDVSADFSCYFLREIEGKG